MHHLEDNSARRGPRSPSIRSQYTSSVSSSPKKRPPAADLLTREQSSALPIPKHLESPSRQVAKYRSWTPGHLAAHIKSYATFGVTEGTSFTDYSVRSTATWVVEERLGGRAFFDLGVENIEELDLPEEWKEVLVFTWRDLHKVSQRRGGTEPLTTEREQLSSPPRLPWNMPKPLEKSVDLPIDSTSDIETKWYPVLSNEELLQKSPIISEKSPLPYEALEIPPLSPSVVASEPDLTDAGTDLIAINGTLQEDTFTSSDDASSYHDVAANDQVENTEAASRSPVDPWGAYSSLDSSDGQQTSPSRDSHSMNTAFEGEELEIRADGPRSPLLIQDHGKAEEQQTRLAYSPPQDAASMTHGQSRVPNASGLATSTPIIPRWQEVEDLVQASLRETALLSRRVNELEERLAEMEKLQRKSTLSNPNGNGPAFWKSQKAFLPCTFVVGCTILLGVFQLVRYRGAGT